MGLAIVAGMAVPAPRGAISGAETLGFGMVRCRIQAPAIEPATK
jgi:hypothetical protein